MAACNTRQDKQAALLPVGRQPDAEQFEHVLGGELLHLFDRLAVELLDQHRGGRLADAAAVAVEVHLLERALVVDLQFQPDHVAAQRVGVLMRRGCNADTARDGTAPRSGPGSALGTVLLQQAWPVGCGNALLLFLGTPSAPFMLSLRRRTTPDK